MTATSTSGSLFELSPQMRSLGRAVHLVADTDAAVLIRGESGVGKGLVARAIHDASGRRAKPFVKINCAALPAEILESELFGHEKGAFTGAYRRTAGKFEAANSGTILLDEVGEMPVSLQAKLLHVLQDHQFARVGGAYVVGVDVRVIASTNKNLETAARSGLFREDLYYRLKVVDLHVPPLRERREEIAALALMFVERFNQQYRRRLVLGQDSLNLLTSHSWPGNVRELENMIRRTVVLQNEELLRSELSLGTITPPSQPRETRPRTWNLREIARGAALQAERTAIVEVLESVNWNRSQAAKMLQVSYKTLLYKIDQCGLAKKKRSA